MRKSILAIITLIGCFGILSAQESESKYILKFNDFSELKVVESVNVDYRCNPDSAGLAVFTATPDVAPVLMFTPKKNRLEIQIATEGMKYENLPTVTVYSTYLNKVENSGDSLVRVFKPNSGPKFQAKVIGNGRISVHDVETAELNASIMTGKGQIVVTGKSDNASLTVTGTGIIQADRLITGDCSCKIIGTGTIGCCPSGKLSIYGAGSGDVYYTGSPTSINKRSIGIKAVSLNE